SNSVIITDPGSSWTGGPGSYIYVGSNSSLNRLVVSNGATVESTTMILNALAIASNNEAVVTDPGSRLGAGFFSVGQSWPGSRLVVSNGAVVTSGISCVGENGNGQNNEVVVTGAGSLWTNFNSLTFGEFGGGNRLVITNNGEVFVRNSLT